MIELLNQSRDPVTEEKIVQLLNSPDTPLRGAEMLESFLKTSPRPAPPNPVETNAWTNLARLREANKKYLAAAKLFDAGRQPEALRKLDELLKEAPGYPFGVMLRQLF